MAFRAITGCLTVKTLIGLYYRQSGKYKNFECLEVTAMVIKPMQVKIPSVRIVVFGSGGVGKTSLIKRYLNNSFDEKYQPTIEDDYRKVVTYKGNLCDLTILDTAGTHQFPAMRKLAINNGDGFIIVYSIDDQLSLAEAKRQFEEIRDIKGSEEVPVVLLGNKSDRSPTGRRKISREVGMETVEEWGITSCHMETSARLNHNVTNAFDKILQLIDMQPAYEDVTDQNNTSKKVRRKSSVRRGASILYRAVMFCFKRKKNYKLGKKNKKPVS
eukprot:gene17884-19667_t